MLVGGTSGDAQAVGGPPDLPGLPILVLDDHPETAALLVEIFADEGLPAVATTRVEDALERMERQAFSLVVTDFLIASPERSEDMAARLLALAGPTPVGCITAWRVPARLESSYAFVIHKPFSLERLFCEVARFTVSQEGNPRRLELIRGYFAALTTHDWDALGALCAPEVVYHLPGQLPLSGTIVGRAAFQGHAAQVFASFPDTRFEVAQVVWLPRGAVASYRANGTAPSGGPVVREGAVLFMFEGSGREAVISRVGVRLDLERLAVSVEPGS